MLWKIWIYYRLKLKFLESLTNVTPYSQLMFIHQFITEIDWKQNKTKKLKYFIRNKSWEINDMRLPIEVIAKSKRISWNPWCNNVITKSKVVLGTNKSHPMAMPTHLHPKHAVAIVSTKKIRRLSAKNFNV